MGDMGDYFRDWRDHKKEHKQRRWLDNSAKIESLSRRGLFSYEIQDHGTGHVLINDSIDFWLSTGTWMVRGKNRRGHGFRQLIHFLQDKPNKVEEFRPGLKDAL